MLDVLDLNDVEQLEISRAFELAHSFYADSPDDPGSEDNVKTGSPARWRRLSICFRSDLASSKVRTSALKILHNASISPFSTLGRQPC